MRLKHYLNLFLIKVSKYFWIASTKFKERFKRNAMKLKAKILKISPILKL